MMSEPSLTDIFVPGLTLFEQIILFLVEKKYYEKY